MNYLAYFRAKINYMHKVRLSPLLVVIVVLIFIGCRQKPAQTREAPVEYKTTSPAAIGLEIGNQAPDLAYKSPDGKTITLSSLRGKIVLVDFWASWCMPCRVENPNLVKVYQQYKDKVFSQGNGFTVYSVSLDTKHKNWVDAIEHDGLDWTFHVSDLKGWQSGAVAMYQITSIPSNYLLNAEGIIIDKNLRAEALESTIQTLVQ
jgi:thiol-disulfide isomerase/thioredoxin